MREQRAWERFKSELVIQAKEEVSEFQGGRLAQYAREWESMTSDKHILSIVREGLQIEFESMPVQEVIPKPYKFQKERWEKIDSKIKQYIGKNIVEEVQHEEGDFISNIFSVEKPDGDIRVILDLTELNEFVKDRHFKMETIEIVRTMIRKGCYMSSIDWKDAYFSVSIHKDHRKYLRFVWNGRLYQFTCLPNGLK